MEAQTTSGIKVIEADMNVIISTAHQPKVGFAHCISGDFNNDKKHMSKGVAVTFKKNFEDLKQMIFVAVT
jgi:hypothetical protein